MSRLRFRKCAKLIKTDDFSSVFNFRKRLSSEFLVIHYQPNTLQIPRLGLVVGKKTAKSSVERNYMRRVLRELFRLQQHALSPVDLVIRVQQKFGKKEFLAVQQQYNQLILKINQRTNYLHTDV